MHGRWAQTGWSAEAVSRVTGYALLATIATALALVLRDGLPWVHPEPWVPWAQPVAMGASAALGLLFAAVLIATTRVIVPRWRWGQRLHLELRPVARDLTIGQILLIAGFSSIGEEVLFRGLLTPTVGVVLSAILFGLAHQMKGPSRWVWAGWATVTGLGLGAIFALTGSLVGPLLAHAIVNAANLAYLRAYDPSFRSPLPPAASR